MFAALNNAFADLRDPMLRKSLYAIAAWSLGFFIVLIIVLFGGIGAWNPGVWVENQASWLPSWMDWLVNALAAIVVFMTWIAMVWFGFVVVSQNVAAFYFVGIVERVEELHYADLAPAKGTTIAQDVISTIRFTGVLLLLNLLALPFYLLGMFFPPVSLIMFYLVNGYLFGREYAETVTLRRMPPDQAVAWRKANSTKVWLAGVLIAFGMTVPILNFLGPVIAASFMTHIFHANRLRTLSSRG